MKIKSKHFFGTDGIRGVANLDLPPELFFRIGRCIHKILNMDSPEIPKILIGKDPRLSSDMLEGALIAGILSTGIHAYRLGVISTPAVSILTKTKSFDAGIMISASHNPIEHNGIKIFSKNGLKLSDEEELTIEQFLLQKKDNLPRPVGEKIGLAFDYAQGREHYLAQLLAPFKHNLKDYRISLDCAHGSTSLIAPKLFESLGAKVSPHCAVPNGSKINVNCGATHLEQFKKTVLADKSDFGISFDGDGDRVIFVDEEGEIFNGDCILAALAIHWNKIGKLRGPVVATVMANFGLEKALNSYGIPMVRAQVGDRFVLEEMIRHHSNLGGEQSGHLILLDHAWTGDGCLTALHIIEILIETKSTLSKLRKLIQEFPQLLVNVPVQNKKRFHADEEIQKTIDAEAFKLKGRGRILVRPSGTEPLVRVMAEGPDSKELEDVVTRVAKTIELRLK